MVNDHQSSAHEGLRLFGFCVVLENPESNEAWKKRIEWITSSQNYTDLPMEFDWLTSFRGSV